MSLYIKPPFAIQKLAVHARASRAWPGRRPMLTSLHAVEYLGQEHYSVLFTVHIIHRFKRTKLFHCNSDFLRAAAMQARTSHDKAVCLSVCLSVVCVYCDKTNESSADILIPC